GNPIPAGIVNHDPALPHGGNSSAGSSRNAAIAVEEEKSWQELLSCIASQRSARTRPRTLRERRSFGKRRLERDAGQVAVRTLEQSSLAPGYLTKLGVLTRAGSLLCPQAASRFVEQKFETTLALRHRDRTSGKDRQIEFVRAQQQPPAAAGGTLDA